MKSVLVFLFIFLLTSVSAQVVPLNPDVLYGKLDNGLTYYILKNSLPKERAMFYLAVNAGAVNENADQNGLAHFCEHMAFNGTKNFPGKGILNYLESIGVSFGGGLNAYTNSDITCYTLNNIPTNRQGYIDSALIVLREWAANVSYSTKEIKKEHRVIHEEWRTGGGAYKRMSDKVDKILFQGSKYADHNVIGDVSIIDNDVLTAQLFHQVHFLTIGNIRKEKIIQPFLVHHVQGDINAVVRNAEYPVGPLDSQLPEIRRDGMQGKETGVKPIVELLHFLYFMFVNDEIRFYQPVTCVVFHAVCDGAGIKKEKQADCRNDLQYKVF